MSIYKIIITKTVFVEAKNEEEAQEIAFKGLEIMSDEVIENVAKSSSRAMQEFMFAENLEQTSCDTCIHCDLHKCEFPCDECIGTSNNKPTMYIAKGEH